MSRQNSSLYKELSKVLFLAAALVVALWFLHEIERVLIASLLALILAMVINAPVTWMEKRNIPRGAGTAISFVGLLAVAGLVGWLVVPRLIREIPTLVEQIPELLGSLADQISATIGDHPEVQRQLDRIIDWIFDAVEGLWQYADVVAALLVIAVFVLALVLYMVANMRPMLRSYIQAMPPHLRDPATRAFSRASEMVIGWVVASVILGAIKAVVAFVFLMLMGIPGALVWSVLAFFGAFIPRIGFYIMAVPPVLVAFTIHPFAAVWTLVFYVVFSEILGNFIAPKIYADRMQLNAVLILVMMLAMGYAFGVIGILIATPVAGFVKAYYDEFFLARRPVDEDLDDRVEKMIHRKSVSAVER